MRNFPLTFWLAYLLGCTGVFFLATWQRQYNNADIVRICLWAVYCIFATVFTWRTANRYAGPRLWRVGAKATMVLGMLGVAAMTAIGLIQVDYYGERGAPGSSLASPGR